MYVLHVFCVLRAYVLSDVCVRVFGTTGDVMPRVRPDVMPGVRPDVMPGVRPDAMPGVRPIVMPGVSKSQNDPG